MPRNLGAHKAALYGCALQQSMTDVVIYTTSMATTSKIKKDTYRIKQLLDTKKVPYTEVTITAAAARVLSHGSAPKGLVAY